MSEVVVTACGLIAIAGGGELVARVSVVEVSAGNALGLLVLSRLGVGPGGGVDWRRLTMMLTKYGVGELSLRAGKGRFYSLFALLVKAKTSQRTETVIGKRAGPGERRSSCC